jgi:hypothetical protein
MDCINLTHDGDKWQFFWTSWGNVEFRTMWGICWTAKELQAPQAKLYSKKSVTAHMEIIQYQSLIK